MGEAAGVSELPAAGTVRRGLGADTDLHRKAAAAGRRARRIHSQEEVAGRFNFELLAAADQDRHALRLQPGDQGPGRGRDYRKASAGGTAHSRRIAVFR